jgi:aspartate oxidase
MGGIAVDAHGRTSLKGLWAGGEVSCTGAHGANRLASNSLLEAVVYAARIAEDIAGQTIASPSRAPMALVTPRNCAMPPLTEANLRAMMTSHVGVIRDGDRLAEAVRSFADLERDTGNIAAGSGVSMDAARKPRRAVSHRSSRRKPGPGASHPDDAGGGAGYRGIAVGPHSDAVGATR